VPGEEIGKGDGSASSVTFAEIHTLTKTASLGDPEPVDLAFNPTDPGEPGGVGYGDHPTPVEETRSAPVVVPDLAATRKFPRRSKMFA